MAPGAATLCGGDLGGYFGFDVDIDGDTLVAGAFNAGVGGRVYVFDRVGTTWTATQDFDYSTVASIDRFGIGVDVEGTLLLVGADFGGADDQGEAAVFRRNGGTWLEETVLTGVDAEAFDQVAAWISLDDDGSIILGGRFGTAAGVPDAGAAYAFDVAPPEPANKLISQPGSDTEDGSELGDIFGFSVAIDGNRLAVGTPQWNGSGGNLGSLQSGSVLLFTRASVVDPWVFDERIENPDVVTTGNVTDGFGWSVALSGDRVLVGAPSENGPNDNSGRAYVFDLATPGPVIELNPAATGSRSFGTEVAIDGDVLAVGAPGYDGTHPERGPRLRLRARRPHVGRERRRHRGWRSRCRARPGCRGRREPRRRRDPRQQR